MENLLYAAELPTTAWRGYRAVMLPGLTVSVQEMVDSLQAIAGENVARRITWQRDPFIEKLVGSWPTSFAPNRARSMGFKSDDSMAEIIRIFIEDDLAGNFVA